MRDIRCPRCGSLMGRVNGEAQLRCKRARCYAIVNVDTNTGKAVMIRYGAGNSYTRCHEETTLDAIDTKYLNGEFSE